MKANTDWYVGKLTINTIRLLLILQWEKPEGLPRPEGRYSSIGGIIGSTQEELTVYANGEEILFMTDCNEHNI